MSFKTPSWCVENPKPLDLAKVRRFTEIEDDLKQQLLDMQKRWPAWVKAMEQNARN